jgi:cation-transporting P-type ATPase D
MRRKGKPKEKDSKHWLKNNKDNLRTTKVYGGCRVYSPSGNLMFLCVEKKAKWYLDRVDKKTGTPLAVKINHINPIINFLMGLFFIKPKNLKIKLQFEPKAEGNKGDKYSLSKKNNKCVVTGDTNLEQLTKHHITPYCYRMFMPEEYKTANSHDIVPIISEKHYEYERHADELKNNLAKKYDAPLDGKKNVDHKLFYAIKSARALMKFATFMPKENVDRNKEIIRAYTGQKRVTQKIIEELCETEFDKANKLKSHGEIVVEKLELEGNQAIQDFVEMWREHFIKTMQPKYMPKHWDVKRPASRLNLKKD